jgi:hypothetical protein
VAETREQGIQVTKEVQLAAQKLVRENAKLRNLLRRTGYTDDVIDARLKDDRCLHDTERPQPVSKETFEKSAQKVAPACESQTGSKPESRNLDVEEGKPVPMEAPESGECLKKSSPLVVSCNEQSEVPSVEAQYPSPSPRSDSTGAPCRLLTLLAKNPAADITQVPFSGSVEQPCKPIESSELNSDGIECSTAYKMLMRYPTSAEKMDRIAAALESGCTPSAAGGCKVKKSVIWRALDEECI